MLRPCCASFLVCASRLNIAIGIDDIRRSVCLLHLHLGNGDPGSVGVESLLHQISHLIFNRRTILCEDRLDLRLADHLAHGAFGDRLNRLRRIVDVEEIFCCVLMTQPT